MDKVGDAIWICQRSNAFARSSTILLAGLPQVVQAFCCNLHSQKKIDVSCMCRVQRLEEIFLFLCSIRGGMIVLS